MAQRKKNFTVMPPHELKRMVRVLGDELNRAMIAAEAQRRIVWMLVHDRGGRVELNRDDYKQMVAAPMADCVIKLEDDKANNVVILNECDAKGEPVSKIIRLPGA